MSSLRNAVKRITHKERSQPVNRAHLGILEKKKDYKLRADEYHRAQDRTKAMQRKASMRNPDEFYFGMHNSQVRDGKHRPTMDKVQKDLQDRIGPEAVRIMKEQDLSYVRMQKQRDAKKVERLASSLHFIDPDSSKKQFGRKHTVFVASREEAENFDVANHFDTPAELVDRSFNRPRMSQLRQQAVEARDAGITQKEFQQMERMKRKAARKAARKRAVAYGELEARKKRVEAMEVAEAHLVTEKFIAGKGRKRKIKGAEDGKPAQYKWARKRTR